MLFLVGSAVLGGSLGCEREPASPPAGGSANQAVAPQPQANVPGWQEKNTGGSLFREDLFNFDKTPINPEGGLDPAVFRRVMNKRKSSFKVCYKKALDRNPEAKGEVRLRINVSPTGRVSTVQALSDTLRDDEAVECLLRVVRRVQFPPLESGQRASLEYPLVFSP